jgi:GT2 family glycosyltransferase
LGKPDHISDAQVGSAPSVLPLVSVLIASRDRPKLVVQCLDSVLAQHYPRFEIVVFDDASRQNLAETLAGHFGQAPIRWTRSEQRLGVAGSRNHLVHKAAGEILVFLDDDATLENPCALQATAAYFASIPNLGTLAFKIIVAVNGRTSLQVPFPRRWHKKIPSLADSTTQVSYYVGAGHAIRKEVFRRCGLYQQDLVYGDEELDHAYRQIEAGFSLLYAPEITVRHSPASSVVQPDRDGRNKLYYLIRNRIWNGYKHIPFPYLVSYLGGWILYFLAVGFRYGCLWESLSGAVAGIAALRSLPRKRLDAQAVAYLKANYGRLWY